MYGLYSYPGHTLAAILNWFNWTTVAMTVSKML